MKTHLYPLKQNAVDMRRVPTGGKIGYKIVICCRHSLA